MMMMEIKIADFGAGAVHAYQIKLLPAMQHFTWALLPVLAVLLPLAHV